MSMIENDPRLRERVKKKSDVTSECQGILIGLSELETIDYE